MGPFDFVKSINTKNRLPLTGEYCKFLTTRQLSYFPDTIMWANEVNRDIEDFWHYEFLFQGVPPGNRFSKWAKQSDAESIKVIAAYYGFSFVKAVEGLKALSQEQVDIIKDWYFLQYGASNQPA